MPRPAALVLTKICFEVCQWLRFRLKRYESNYAFYFWANARDALESDLKVFSTGCATNDHTWITSKDDKVPTRSQFCLQFPRSVFCSKTESKSEPFKGLASAGGAKFTFFSRCSLGEARPRWLIRRRTKRTLAIADLRFELSLFGRFSSTFWRPGRTWVSRRQKGDSRGARCKSWLAIWRCTCTTLDFICCNSVVVVIIRSMLRRTEKITNTTYSSILDIARFEEVFFSFIIASSDGIEARALSLILFAPNATCIREFCCSMWRVSPRYAITS